MLLNELYNNYINAIILEKKRTTLDSINYRYVNRLHPKFGDMDIKDITEDIVRDYQKEMLYDEKLSADYVNRIIGILKQILEYGVRRRYLSHNQLSCLKKVKDQFRIEKKQVVWELETFQIFESFIADDVDKLMFNMLYFLGIRKGELLSLKWSAINFERKTVRIVSTAVQIVGKGQIITTPKTNHSIREICMNDSLFNMLQKHYFKIKFEYDVVNHLFVFGNDKMVSFSALDRKMAKYIQLSQVERMNLHGFRHSHATMLINLTTDVKSISERLGHESVDVTLNEYIHSNDIAQKELANLIENEVVKSDETLGFQNFTSYLEKMLLREITKDNYKELELKGMINIYNFIKNHYNSQKISLHKE